MASTLDDLRKLLQSPRELWLIYVMKLLESIAYFAIYNVLVIFLSADLGYSDVEAGGIAGIWLTAISLLVFVSGFVADTLGLRSALLLATVSCGLGRALVTFGDSRALVLLGLTVMVWGVASMKPTMNAAVRAYSTPSTVAFAFSLYYVLMNVGSVVQGPIITQFRSLYRDGAVVMGVEMSSSELVFAVGLIASLINVGLATLVRDPVGVTRAANPASAAREVIREPAFWRFMAFIGLLTMVRLVFQHAHLTWPKYAIREFGESFAYANYWAINPALIILLTPFATAATRSLPVYPTIVFGAILSSLSVFAMAFSTTITASVVFIVVLSLGEALWSPRLYEYTATIAPRGREASYMGLSEIPLFLAKPVVGFLSGWLLTMWCPAEGPRNSTLIWWVVGGMTLIAPVGMLFLRRRLEIAPTRA